MDANQLSLLVKDIERCISTIGIMYRIFYREKSQESLIKKIEKDPSKYNNNKKIQDILGVRIAFYFVDDLEVIKSALEKKFEFLPKDSQIDSPSSETFSAVRCNLIFRLPKSYDIGEVVDAKYLSIIDNTFEIQLRTVLSEGWHEVDHDLRFKCKDDWIGLDKENRAFNGVYATLETSEWTLLKLFEDLAYKHYKSSNIRAMLINKFRLRIKESPLDEEMINHLQSRSDLIKIFYRYDRTRMLKHLSDRPFMPITLSNLIFIMNADLVKDEWISSMTGKRFNKWWETIAENKDELSIDNNW